MSKLGKLMQITALFLLPASMFLEISGSLGRDFGVSDMVIMLVFGVGLFIGGRYLEGYAAANDQ